jgi:hypothetical protein
MNMKIWIATYVDHGETCDGKARVLDVCKSKEEAEAAVRADIEKWADDRATEDIYVDFDAMAAGYNRNADEGCEWNIEERTFDVTEEDEQADLVDDGQMEFDFAE